MPVYIKLYYTCAIYFLLWFTGLGIWFTYNIIRYAVHDRDGAIAAMLILLVLAVTLVKGLVSIKAWQCYRRAAQLTTAAHRLFVTMYYFTLLLGLGLLLLVIFVIPGDLRQNYTYGSWLSPTIILLDGGVLLLTIASVYFAITDWFMLKAIRKKQEENLMSFEVGEGS